MNGHLSWLGEFGECRNTSSTNLTGKYALLVQDFDVETIMFTHDVSFKYGFCIPDKCTALDTSNIINSRKLYF